MVLIPKPDDRGLLMELHAFYRAVDAKALRVTGLPTLGDAAETVNGWVERAARKDPDLLVLLARTAQRASGALVAEFQRPSTAVLCLMRARDPQDGRVMGHILRAWAASCGAHQILGYTFRDPRAWARRWGARHVGDQYVLEAA